VDDIVAEARSLVERGAREITLLGQKVNSYLVGDADFAALLEQLDAVEGLLRLRFTSPHPRFMSERLVSCFGRLPTLCESIHLPVQSGSDTVLRRMRRRYDSGLYRDVVAALRRACPEIAVSTDLIVGFPGETEQEFEETLALIEDVRFSGAFSFKYSPRPGTRAAKLLDDVPAEEKSRRLAEVHRVIGQLETEARQRLVGDRLEVLVESRGRNPGQFSGRARNSQIVNFVPEKGDSLEEIRGRLCTVEVTAALPHSLEGRPPER
jgi:tRNA-2-methylthio-N6-dimethylallyladenosine synthase